ncbi:MAG: D-alanine--D-alanine ligase [Patescibacteria group bacterium]
MGKINVGIMRGGPSSEYEVSLNTGGEILKYLPEKYSKKDILLDKKGELFVNGFFKKPVQVFDLAQGGVNVIFNAMHGEFGEDGRAQQVFESFNVPYTGSGIFSSSVAMRKDLSRDIFVRNGIKVPRALFFTADDLFGIDEQYCAKQVFNTMFSPWVVKPVSTGSSVGISVCNSFPELVAGIEDASGYGKAILIEEYIDGAEATCGILENFRGQKNYALPVVEIIPPKGSFFDYKVKYDGSTHEICPAGFDNSIKKEIENIALRAHRVLGCRHYSRADFMIGKKGIYLLEVNTLPGMTAESLYPKAARAAGLEFPQLLDHLIKLALRLYKI